MKFNYSFFALALCISLTACGSNSNDIDNQVSDEITVTEAETDIPDISDSQSVEATEVSDFDMEAYKKLVLEFTELMSDSGLNEFLNAAVDLEETLWGVYDDIEEGDNSDKTAEAFINTLQQFGGREAQDKIMEEYKKKYEEISNIDTVGNDEAAKLEALVTKDYEALVELYNALFDSPWHNLEEYKENSHELLSIIEECESELKSNLK